MFRLRIPKIPRHTMGAQRDAQKGQGRLPDKTTAARACWAPFSRTVGGGPRWAPREGAATTSELPKGKAVDKLCLREDCYL